MVGHEKEIISRGVRESATRNVGPTEELRLE